MKKLNKKGFTMVELIIVIVIIGVLAAVLIPTFGGIIRKANDSAYQQERTNQMIQDAIEKIDKGKDNYLSWEDLEEAIANALNNQNPGGLANKIIAIIKGNDKETGLTNEQLTAILEAIANKKLSDIQVRIILEGIKNGENPVLTEQQITDILAKLPQVGITKEDINAAVNAVLGETNTVAVQIKQAIADALDHAALSKEDIAAIINQIIESNLEAIGDYVARIGRKGYETLAAAVADAKDGDTIVMLKDDTLTATVIVSKTITIDLNGKTVGRSNIASAIGVNGGNLTINDSAGSGSIFGNGQAVYTNAAGDVLTVNGGTIQGSTYGLRFVKGNTVTINGGNIIGGSHGIYNQAAQTLNITDGTISGSQYGVRSTSTIAVTTISGGTITGLSRGADNAGILNINGGLIKSTQTDKSKWSYGIYSSGTVTVNGGNVESALVGIYNNNGIVNIDGGTVSGSKGIMGGGTVNLKSGSIDAGDIGISEYKDTQTLKTNMSGGEIISPNVGVSLQGSSSLNMSGGTIRIQGMEAGKTATFGVYSQKSASVTVSGSALIENLNPYGKDSNDKDCFPYGIDLETGTESKGTTLKLQAGTISVPNGYAVSLGEYADVTIENGTINASNAVTSWRASASCTITGGTFNATAGQVCYAYEGFFTISGGKFTGGKTSQYDENQYRFALNCYDSHYTDGSAGFTVTGGSFYQFNPENDLSEGANTCFTPDGYHAEYDEETGYYTVVENN